MDVFSEHEYFIVTAFNEQIILREEKNGICSTESVGQS